MNGSSGYLEYEDLGNWLRIRCTITGGSSGTLPTGKRGVTVQKKWTEGPFGKRVKEGLSERLRNR